MEVSMIRWKWGIVFSLLLSACAAQGGEPGPKEGRELAGADTGRVAVGSKAPDFTLEDADGGRRTLSEFRGKRVVLVFFRGGW
jgi:cytochrome oxidase Cu insertion factor (SCO1/SenC/PrrC family)